jgi:tetratricopeptide (TPR) repeat protein
MIRAKRSSLFCALILLALVVPALAQQSNWAAHMHSAKQARQTGNHDAAEKHFQAAVEEAERMGPDELRLASSLNSLALLYQAQERYAEAEPLFERSLELLEKKLGPEHQDVATCLANLGMLRVRRKAWLKAEPPLQRALKIREKRLGENHLNVADSLYDLATLYVTQDRIPLKRVTTPRPEPITPLTPRLPHSDIANPRYISILPTVLPPMPSGTSGTDYAEEAQSLLKRALAIRAKLLGNEHPETLGTMDRLASVCLMRRDFDCATRLYSQSLEIRDRQVEPDVAKVLGNIYALAQSLAVQRKYAKAEPLAERGLRLTEQHKGGNRGEVAAAAVFLAEVYRQRRRYADAEPFYQRALALLEDQPGQRRIAAWVMQQYALLLRATRRWDEAKEMQARANK